jgi:hypothetical protein
MNFGPLEFADYLRRKDDGRAGELATVTAARAAAPAPPPLDAGLKVRGTSRPAPTTFDGIVTDEDTDSEL